MKKLIMICLAVALVALTTTVYADVGAITEKGLTTTIQASEYVSPGWTISFSNEVAYTGEYAIPVQAEPVKSQVDLFTPTAIEIDLMGKSDAVIVDTGEKTEIQNVSNVTEKMDMMLQNRLPAAKLGEVLKCYTFASNNTTSDGINTISQSTSETLPT